MKVLIDQGRSIVQRAKQRCWRFLAGRKPGEPFPGSASYWDRRYSSGGDSGVGSYEKFAEFKAEVLNAFVEANHVRTVIELGCGDGNQLRLARYPSYIGFDVSAAAIGKCGKLFQSDQMKSFRLMRDYAGERADLSLSLDVIYHLVEDDLFEGYMRTLFGASNHFVIIYSSDSEDNRGYEGTHVWHRKFTRWVREHFPDWRLIEHLPNRYPYRGDYRTGSFAEFFIYEKA